MSSWVWRAKCRDHPPEHYYSENVSDREAEQLCSGCPVRVECGRDALAPMDVSEIYRVLGVGECVVLECEGVVRNGVRT